MPRGPAPSTTTCGMPLWSPIESLCDPRFDALLPGLLGHTPTGNLTRLVGLDFHLVLVDDQVRLAALGRCDVDLVAVLDDHLPLLVHLVGIHEVALLGAVLVPLEG